MATTEELVEQLSGLTVLEVSDLVKALEEKWGVSAAAPAGGMVMAAGPAGGEAAPAAEEKDEFDIILESFGDNKIGVIKEVRGAVPFSPKNLSSCSFLEQNTAQLRLRQEYHHSSRNFKHLETPGLDCESTVTVRAYSRLWQPQTYGKTQASRALASRKVCSFAVFVGPTTKEKA